MRKIFRVSTLVAILAMSLLAGAGPASAHEGREVGEYHFTVGWGDEPAYSGFKNSVSLHLTDHDDRPVASLGSGGLKVEVIFGTQTVTLDMEPNFRVGAFGEVGDYRAWLVPVRAGSYVFHFTGGVRGQRVDERFTCGESTFDCITDQSAIAFPTKDPSTAQLAERLDREVPRLERTVATGTASAKDDADQAKLFGIIGIAVGVLGLIAGPIWGRRSRKKAA